MLLLCFAEHIPIISMNNIYQLISVMDTRFVYSEIGTEYLWKCIESIPQKKITISHSGNSY
jgi:hypothetical protein